MKSYISHIGPINKTRKIINPNGFALIALKKLPSKSFTTDRVEPHDGHGWPEINLIGQAKNFESVPFKNAKITQAYPRINRLVKRK